MTHLFGAHTAGATTTTKETGKSPGDVVVDGLDENFNFVKYFNQTRPEHPQAKLIVAEDNEAVIKIISKSRSTALRHLPRTHRIEVNLLFEVCNTPEVIVRYTNTKQQIADLMTKAMTKPDVWNHFIDLAQIRRGPFPEGQREGARPTTTTTTTARALAVAAAACKCRDCGLWLIDKEPLQPMSATSAGIELWVLGNTGRPTNLGRFMLLKIRYGCCKLFILRLVISTHWALTS